MVMNIYLHLNVSTVYKNKGEGYRFGVVHPADRQSGCPDVRPSVRHKLVGAISQRLLQI